MHTNAPARTVTVTLAAIALATALLIATALRPPGARASELVDRGVKNVHIAVNGKGVALLTYRKGRASSHILYWGGINWSLRFAGHDRSGGARSHKGNWKHFRNTCGTYRGPRLQHVVAACTARDGSSWVAQAWPRTTANYGGTGGPVELRLSHFTGDPAALWIKTDWEYHGMWEHLYGQYTYQGQPVYGNKVTPDGQSLDMKGRNIAIDSYDSDYPGTRGAWARVNSFLANAPNGQFCFGFAPKGGSRYTGRSRVEKYRASVPGPGVSPDVFIGFTGHGAYDPALDAQANAEQAQLRGDNTTGSCRTIN